MLVAALVPAIAAAAPAAPQDDFPTTAGDARRYYDGWIDNWTSGPAEALMTQEEREIWGNLQDTTQRERFIRWFWDRRDPDGRAVGNRYQEDFYERVAEANARFRGFPRGWKSDRGRVKLVLGDPDTVSRQTYSQIVGAGNGPDFEVWSYSNLGNNRSFQGPSGEYLVYFAETRPAQYEIFDWRWGAGVWDRNIRLAFELTVDGSIVDPMMEFDAGEARGDFVREISEGTLPAEIPTGIWAALGGGNAVSVPVQIELGDLLFQPDGEQYVARLEAALTATPAAGGEATRVTEAWEIRLSEADLLALGNGSLLTAVTAPASPGLHRVELEVSHPLAATAAVWSQDVTVAPGPATAIVVGRTPLSLSPADPAAMAVLMPADGIFPSGAPLVVGAWMRGAQADPAAISVQLEAGSGTYALEIEEARWLDGVAGPLLVRALVPELEAGEYTLRIDFGAGLESATIAVQIGDA
jgi:GWxTD domain-containing protein